MQEDGLAASSPFDWEETGEAADGDWPPMPTALSLKVFTPEDHTAWSKIYGEAVAGRLTDTVLNGEYLEIDARNEAELVTAFEQLGVASVRDDHLFDVFGA
jgi:hypothetical protein